MKFLVTTWISTDELDQEHLMKLFYDAAAPQWIKMGLHEETVVALLEWTRENDPEAVFTAENRRMPERNGVPQVHQRYFVEFDNVVTSAMFRMAFPGCPPVNSEEAENMV